MQEKIYKHLTTDIDKLHKHTLVAWDNLDQHITDAAVSAVSNGVIQEYAQLTKVLLARIS